MSDLKVNEVKTDTIKNQAGSFSIETTAMVNTPCFSATIGSGLTNQSNNIAVKIPFNTATFNQGGGTFDTSRMAELMGYGQPEEAKRDMVAVDTLKKAGKSVNDVPEALTNALTRDYSDLMKAMNKKGE